MDVVLELFLILCFFLILHAHVLIVVFKEVEGACFEPCLTHVVLSDLGLFLLAQLRMLRQNALLDEVAQQFLSKKSVDLQLFLALDSARAVKEIGEN